MIARNYSDEPPRFSRQWWLAGARNLVFVSLVTIVVWIFADVENSGRGEFRAVIQLAAPTGSDFVLRSDSRINVTFRVQGHRSSIERLRTRLGDANDARVGRTVIRYEVGPDDVDIPAVRILNTYELIAKEGLTVQSAVPGNLRVSLARKVRRELPVTLECTGGIPAETPQISPTKLGFSVVESDWEDLLKRQPNPVLRTVRKDLKEVKDDELFEVEVVPRLGELAVELDQPTVKVKVKVGQITETEKASVPVEVLSPAGWLEDGTWKKFTLKRQNPTEWLISVQVAGPRKDLDQLKTGETKIGAMLVLGDEDKQPVSWLTREVQFRLPTQRLKVVGPAATVTFKLEAAGG
jgi:hypothetical protein